MTYRKKARRAVDHLADRAAADLPIDGPVDFDRMTLRRDPAAFGALLDYYAQVGEAPFSERRRHRLLDDLRGTLDGKAWRQLYEEIEHAIACHRSAGFQLGAAVQRRLVLQLTTTST